MDDIAASLYMEEDYGDMPAGETGENKANLSLRERSQFDATGPAAGTGEVQKSAKAATG